MARNIREQQALLIDGLTEKVTPVSGDLVTIADSADSYKLKKAQAGNLPGGSSSPLTTKGDIYTRNATVDARLPVGTNGQVLSADSGETTGLKWITSTSGGGGGAYNEDKFSTTGTETPGATVNFVLDATPMTSTNTPSGRALTVFRGGVKMDYAATLTTYNQYYYDSVNNRVQVLAPGSADEYEVVYWSTGVGGQPYLYLIEDNFDDSSIHPRWTTYVPAGSSITEGSDGLVMSIPASATDWPWIKMDVPDFINRMWFYQAHITITNGDAETTDSMMRLEGLGNNASRYFGTGLRKGAGLSIHVYDSATGGELLGITAPDGTWLRFRFFGDEVRADYYLGAKTVNVDGEGRWREWDCGKTFYPIPKNDTFNYPTKYQTLRFSCWSFNTLPATTITIRKFKFAVL